MSTLRDETPRKAKFLRALLNGCTVREACATAPLKWSTVYRWRQSTPEFRTAWDEATALGAEARRDHYDSLLHDRVTNGVPVPVYYRGAEVGERRRFSDSLLAFALREFLGRAPPVPPHAQALLPELGNRPRVKVVLRRYADGPPPDLDD